MNARRQFLRGHTRAAPPLRPPHALAEDAFIERCTRCDACREACTPGALAADGPAWTLQLVFESSCIAQANVVCRSCGDCCGVRAIRFPPRQGAAAVPVVDESLCNHCGACVSACPVAAIQLRPAMSTEAIV